MSTSAKAIGMAMNREEMVSHWKGVEFMQSMFRGEFACELPAYEQDVEGAKALLAEAGWADSDGDGILEKDGMKFSVRLSSYTGWNREDEQVVLVDQLKARRHRGTNRELRADRALRHLGRGIAGPAR